MTTSGVIRVSPIVKKGTSTNFRYDVDVGKATSMCSASGWANLAPSLNLSRSLSDATDDVMMEHPSRVTTADSTTNAEWWRVSWWQIC